MTTAVRKSPARSIVHESRDIERAVALILSLIHI